jgi:hypothetical protein
VWAAAGVGGGAAIATATLWALAARAGADARRAGPGEPGHFAADAQRLQNQAVALEEAGTASLIVTAAAVALGGVYWLGR